MQLEAVKIWHPLACCSHWENALQSHAMVRTALPYAMIHEKAPKESGSGQRAAPAMKPKQKAAHS